jgi:hypothetical protein
VIVTFKFDPAMEGKTILSISRELDKLSIPYGTHVPNLSILICPKHFSKNSSGSSCVSLLRRKKLKFSLWR